MSLAAGTRLGPYGIVAPLGAGGMGEVYRATDTKLHRDVALKVLPDLVAGDPDRLARFRREAQVLASLNHPGIAAIYGVEDSGPTHALVLELVEGPTLADRLDSGPIPLADALPIARQIADAVEAAHELGIIHRDLKPANIKVRPDGTVKVLDFGLARALGPDPASAATDAMNSPTLSARATQMGVILGTAAYMSPEQARGRVVDRRADIWAFGVVLYEMLAGRRAFEGDDISITLASVLKEDVAWQALPPDLPAPIRRLLRRCLEKDPKRRLSAIADARLDLDEAASGPADRDEARATIPASPTVVVPAWRRALPWVVAAAATGAAITTIALLAPWRSTPAPNPRKLLAQVGADVSLPGTFGASAILSPDGTMLAFVGQQGQSRLFVRKLDQLEATVLGGTEDAANPFFSPNGEWIAFFAGGKLKKVSATGGAAITLCDAPGGRGGTWTADDTIIFTPNAAPQTALLRVAAAGGAAAPFGVLSPGATTQRWPQALPDGKGVVFTEHVATSGFDAANLVVAPPTGGAVKTVVRGGYYGRYVSRGPASSGAADGGHLVYMHQGTLFAVGFDLDRLETIGQAVPALEGMAGNPATGGAQMAFSADGTLVYGPGSARTAGNAIDWMTRDGKTSPLRPAGSLWNSPRFSPDGQRLALVINDGKQWDIWVYEWARDTLTQLTFDAGRDTTPVWSPDSRRIIFGSDRAKPGVANLYWVNADGSGDVHRLTDSPNDQRSFSIHPTGRFLSFQENRGTPTTWDLLILPLDGEAGGEWRPGKPAPFLSSPAVDVFPMFSPDGRWIAYFSNEAGGGSFDTYVRPFPGPGGKWRISTEEGTFPRWSAGGRELLFLSRGRVMFAPYSAAGDSFRADKPQVWSPTGYISLGTENPYDLHPDGKRLAIIPASSQTDAGQNLVVFLFNFADHLERIAPGRAR